MGLCGCGCGSRTAIAPRTDVTRGMVKGRPLRFIHGHQDGTPRRRPDWAASVVAFLATEKARGERSFTVAWANAVKAHPPRARDMGEPVPTLFPIEDGQQGPDVSVVEFTEFVCGQAWHDYVGPEPGQGKALSRFTPDLLANMADSSEPAVRTFRAEAA